MSERALTVTLQPDWRAALREAGRRAQKRGCQGEVLVFESAGAFFGQLTERRWALLHALQSSCAAALASLSLQPAKRGRHLSCQWLPARAVNLVAFLLRTRLRSPSRADGLSAVASHTAVSHPPGGGCGFTASTRYHRAG